MKNPIENNMEDDMASGIRDESIGVYKRVIQDPKNSHVLKVCLGFRV